MIGIYLVRYNIVIQVDMYTHYGYNRKKRFSNNFFSNSFLEPEHCYVKHDQEKKLTTFDWCIEDNVDSNKCTYTNIHINTIYLYIRLCNNNRRKTIKETETTNHSKTN